MLKRVGEEKCMGEMSDMSQTNLCILLDDEYNPERPTSVTPSTGTYSTTYINITNAQPPHPFSAIPNITAIHPIPQHLPVNNNNNNNNQ